MKKYFNFKDKKIKNLINDICQEHGSVSKLEDSNMSYLWYMYSTGTKKGDFKPFIFLTEKDNMLSMLLSQDEDNANITAYSILTLRNLRVKEKGLWTADNKNYKNFNYTSDIINPDFFK